MAGQPFFSRKAGDVLGDALQGVGGVIGILCFLDEIIDRYGDPPRGVLNLIDIALLRAQARQAGIQDIKQKAGEILFTFHNLNFEAATALCSDDDYRQRVQFVATAKKPTLRLKLSAGADSLKQSRVFVTSLRKYCGLS